MDPKADLILKVKQRETIQQYKTANKLTEPRNLLRDTIKRTTYDLMKTGLLTQKGQIVDVGTAGRTTHRCRKSRQSEVACKTQSSSQRTANFQNKTGNDPKYNY